MSKAREEILRLVAEGKITPEEGDRLIAALDAPTSRQDPGHSTGFGEGIGQLFQEIGDAVRRGVEEAVSAAQRTFEEHHAGTTPIDVRSGSFDLPQGIRLRVQPAVRFSFGGGSRGGHVIIRGVDGPQARILRGEAVEVHRRDDEIFLTWAKGNLELELPRHCAALDVRCMGGDLEVE